MYTFLTTTILISLFCRTLAAQSEPDLYDDSKLRSIELSFSQSDWWKQLLANRASETYIKADLKIDQVQLKDVGVRFRGGTSFRDGAATGKYPFRISMDHFVKDQRLWGRRSLVLNNGHYDPTFCREPLAYMIYRDLMPAGRANFVRLVLNKQYWGLYVNVEPTNKDFLKQWYEDNDGHRYKGTSQLSPYAYFPVTHPLVSRPSPNAYLDLRAVALAMNSTNVLQVLPRVFDVQQALHYMAAANVVSDIDGLFRQNYYLYSDPWHGRMSPLPWDLNFTFIQTTSTLLRGYLPALYNAQWQPYIAAWTRGTAEARLDWQGLGQTVTRWHKLIDAAVKADPRKLYSYADFQANLTQDVRIGIINVPGLKPWIEQRRQTLLALIPKGPAIQAATRSPETPGAKDQVSVTLQSGTADDVRIHWRSRGAWIEAPLYDDGKHKDGMANDGIFGASLPAQKAGSTIEYWFEAGIQAKRAAGAISFLPPSGGHRPFSYRVLPSRDGALINEFMARNKNGIRDEKGEHEDWIELVNPTNAPIVLDGKLLTDDLGKGGKWIFPANTVLAPGGTILVWADDEPQDGPLHATFKLDGDGEEIALIDVDGETLLDHVQFPRQEQDVSMGRLFDRVSTWVTYASPSPNKPNENPGCGTRAYSALDRTQHTLAMTLRGPPKIGTQPKLTVTNAVPNSAILLLLAGNGANNKLPGTGIALLVAAPVHAILTLPTDQVGTASLDLPIPADSKLAGLRMYFQAITALGSKLLSSNALELEICGN